MADADGIPLRIIEAPEPAYRPLIQDGTIRPGDCWREDWHEGESGWRVILPNGTTFHTRQPATDGTHWETTGEAPGLTLTPSIFDHSPGREWHGWIRDGKLVTAG